MNIKHGCHIGNVTGEGFKQCWEVSTFPKFINIHTLSTIIFQSLRHSDFSVLDGQDFMNPGQILIPVQNW
jgi:hypothetical protein